MISARKVLLVGATGFVGRHLRPVLRNAGFDLVCGTRDTSGRVSEEGLRWVSMDVETGDGLEEALEGCDAAFYLYHGMDGGGDYVRRERTAAENFRDAASRVGVTRVVYMGGVQPSGEPSKHLASRLETGRILRDGPVDTVEVRAAMVIGEGSTSWRIVRDLSARLPAMALPSWLKNRSMPILIDDLVVALRGALDFDLSGARVFDAAGAQSISHRDLLKRVAHELGHDPILIDVPAPFPGLSSLWVRLVSGADYEVVKELVQGLTSDLMPTEEIVWTRIPGPGATPLDEAIALVVEDGKRIEDARDAPDERIVARLLRRSEAAA